MDAPRTRVIHNVTGHAAVIPHHEEMTLPEITRHVVGGIPTYTADIAIPFTGSLVFGVGRRDESAVTAGTAHLLEHLIMQRVGKVTVAHNATTGDETVSFFAQGAPALVADFLSRVARAISTLHEITDADVSEQRRIIAAELGEHDERAGRGPLLDRFGAKSIGLLDVGSPGHRSLTRDQALAFADEWFHSGNAALCFTGRIPEGCEVMLPAARPMPEREEATVIRSHAWVANGSTPLCLSIVLDGASNGAAMVAATALVVDQLFAELRTAQHLVYSVEPFMAPLTPDKRFVAFALDPRPADVVAAASSALEVIRRLASEGPTEAMVRDALDQWEQALVDPGMHAESLEALVTSILRGRRATDELSPPDISTVTAEDIRTVIADSLPSVFVTFGEDTLSTDLNDITEALGLPFVDIPAPLYATLGKTELFKRLMTSGVETFNPRMFRGLRRSQFVIDHDRIAWMGPDGAIEIVYDDVALSTYSETHRFWTVLAYSGDLILIDFDDWRAGDKAHSLLQARLPADRQIRIEVAA